MDRMERCTQLKQRLVQYATSHDLQPHFLQMLESVLFDEALLDDRQAMTSLIDTFALEYQLPDGETVIDRFLAGTDDLSEEDRRLVAGWREVREGVFYIEANDAGTLHTYNLVDDEPYTVRSNAGASRLRQFTPRRFFYSRIVPVDDFWLLSGVQTLYRKGQASEAIQAAQQLAAADPEQAFRRPERLEEARRASREIYHAFLACFGADTIALPPQETPAALSRFVRFQTFEFRGEDGKTPAERAGAVSISEADLPAPPFVPADMDLHSLGLTAHPLAGFAILPDYGLLLEAFDEPEKARRDPHRETIRSYAEEPAAPAFVLRRLGERDPERMTRMIAAAYGRKRFDWRRDGEAFLRRYKGDEADEPRFPSIVPIDTSRFDDLLKPRRARAGKEAPLDPEKAIYRLKITLKGIRPAIWRRIEVPGAIGLDALHETIQGAMGWENAHLHTFAIGRMAFGPPMLDEAIDERQARLCDLVEEKDAIGYTYDLGDDWEHTIKVEKVLAPEPDTAYPRCLAGERACPPEDCGGVWGYLDLLAILADPTHENYREMRAWIGNGFDPEFFDLETSNRQLLRRRGRRSRRR